MAEYKLPASFEIKMATEEMLRASSKKWFEALDGTCLDQLPKPIMDISVPTIFIEFDPAELGKMFDGDYKYAQEISDEIDSIIGWEQHFIKLTTRSAKDAFTNFGVTASGKQAISWMSYSERIIDDLARLKWLNTYQAKICVREPFYALGGFGTWEFRCFVKNNNLIAVTDYDYTNPNPEIQKAEYRNKIRKQIENFFTDKICDEMPIPSYVFDLALTHSGWVLIEINPYGLSDPCFLRSYASVESFDGDIAFNFPTAQEGEKG